MTIVSLQFARDRELSAQRPSTPLRRRRRRRLPADTINRIRRILAALDAAITIDALNQPTLHLHALKGDLKGFWAVTVRANWRIIFRFEDGRILDIDLVDYH